MKESIQDRIQLLRKQAGLTQIELAGKIGVPKSQFIRYESKDARPPANIINNLSEVLGTSVDFLISGDKNEKAKASLKNSELIQRFKEVDSLPNSLPFRTNNFKIHVFVSLIKKFNSIRINTFRR